MQTSSCEKTLNFLPPCHDLNSTQTSALSAGRVYTLIDTLSGDVVSIVLAYLDLSTQRTVFKITEYQPLCNRLWQEIDITYIQRVFPNVSIFQARDWEQYCGKMQGIAWNMPEIANKDALALAWGIENVSSLSVADNLGLAILTIPKGLSITDVHHFLAVLRDQTGALDPEPHTLLAQLRDSEVTQATYYIIISTSTINGSQVASVADHATMLRNLGCQVPTRLEMMAFRMTSLAKRCALEASVFTAPLQGFQNQGLLTEAADRSEGFFFANANSGLGAVRTIVPAPQLQKRTREKEEAASQGKRRRIEDHSSTTD